jgi:hypothetical protein
MPFKATAAATPDATVRPLDQAQPLAQGGCVACRPGSNPARPQRIQADLQVSAKSGEQRSLAIASASFHGSLPARRTKEPPRHDVKTAVSTPSAGTRQGSPGSPRNDPVNESYRKTNTKSKARPILLTTAVTAPTIATHFPNL